MIPSSIVRGVVAEALEKDFQPTSSGDQLPNASSDQSTTDIGKHEDESEYTLENGRSGDSNFPIGTAEPAG